MQDITRAAELARLSGERTRRLIAAVRALDAGARLGASDLPGWSRLTVVCHLRYNAHALARMTREALAGRPTSYYPQGRARQRPGTLRPAPGEGPGDVLDDWESAASRLDDAWSAVPGPRWATEVVEPADQVDLGPVPLARLALMRLTEVDVHATDLGIGADDWSPALVEVALPVRLAALVTRRTNHRPFDRAVTGAWVLEATEGPRWLVAAGADGVVVRPAAADDVGRATIGGSGRDLLALLLGRPTVEPLRLGGDVGFARTFARAFPGP